MSRQKKILYITGGIGGESREMEYHIRIIQNIFPDAEIHAVVLYQNLKANIPENVKLLNAGRKRTLNPFGKLINLFSWIKLTSSLKRKNKYYLKISNADPSNLVNLISELITGGSLKKTVFRVAGLLSNISLYQDSKIYGLLYKQFYKILYSLLYNRAYVITFISETARKDAIKFGIKENKAKTIYNPLDIKIITNLSTQSTDDYLEKLYPFIITVGRLTKPKGQWYLLRIFKALKEKHKDLKLVILGEGELKEYLLELSEKLGLKTFVWDRDNISEDFDVYFLGFHKNPFKFMARAKLFVFPSLWEGFPYALVEAMACGVPVVSSDCRSGPREILAPNTDVEYQTNKPEFAEYGVLMPTFEVKFKSAREPLEEKEKMWVEILNRMLMDQSLREEYSKKSKKRAEDFRMEAVIQKWMEVLHG